MRRLAAVLVALVLLGGCSSSVKVTQDGAICKSERSSKFLGLRYSTAENVVRCPDSAG